MAGKPLSFNTSGICYCGMPIPSPHSSFCQSYASFLCYEGYAIVVKAVILKILQSV
jgi:hypothetical protein